MQPFGNVVNLYGRTISKERPLWPATEMLRASHFRDRTAGKASDASDAIVRFLFRHYLNARKATWLNDLADRDRGVPSPIPTRVLYHIIPSLASYCQSQEAAFGDSFLLATDSADMLGVLAAPR
jgi:mannose/cellobiose epimerase-like protein (N-acyl-D-glucosamine 2-epimerase family)